MRLSLSTFFCKDMNRRFFLRGSTYCTETFFQQVLANNRKCKIAWKGGKYQHHRRSSCYLTFGRVLNGAMDDVDPAWSSHSKCKNVNVLLCRLGLSLAKMLDIETFKTLRGSPTRIGKIWRPWNHLSSWRGIHLCRVIEECGSIEDVAAWRNSAVSP